MQDNPYSIYVNKRPLRVAFLVEDKPESLSLINDILAYNRERWGGRYNPIIFTDGQTLTEDWWTLLETIDPDIVKSFVTLSDDLITNIERRIAPYLIQGPNLRDEEKEHRRIDLGDNGLSFLPTLPMIRMASESFSDPILVLFDANKAIDLSIKRFVEWNFGEYSRPIHAVNRALTGVRTQPFQITDATSLTEPLTELSTYRAYTYPIQLCAVPKEALPSTDRSQFCETFQVVIGDAPIDVVYFWNLAATVPEWKRTRLNQVWLPISIATNPQLRDALIAWLQRVGDPTGSYDGGIRFVSLSLSQERLNQIVEPITSKLRISRYVSALQTIEPPHLNEFPPWPIGLEKMDHYRATNARESLTLNEPDIPKGAHGRERWMADLYIEFRSKHHLGMMGRHLWWQLPRLNGLAFQMFGGPSRILRNRYPSRAVMRENPRLNITLFDDTNILTGLVVEGLQNRSCFDASNEKRKKLFAGRLPYDEAWPSDKGRYLSGLLKLFGGLDSAHHIFKNHYWRRMFNLLSGRTAHTDAQRLEIVDNTLRKHIRSNGIQFYENDKAITWLTKLVLRVARSLPAPSRELDFETFRKQARQEIDDFNTSRPDRESWVYSEEDLLNALAGLTERGILLMGIQAKCSSCGYRAWHHINDTKQILQCGGCNAEFPMPPESPWHYRLNSLVRAAYADHGLLPVVLLLNELFLFEGRSALLFAPCLDLFDRNEKGPVGDVDIAAILDGQFIIGEVKQSRDLFDQATFSKMEQIARRLLPDILLFASMDGKPNTLITREISRLSEALKPLGISVRWHSLSTSIFEPSPTL
ncbi:MAG: hypothetical protein AB1405_14755 [Bdellovibrionota bacterium]